MTEYPIYDRLLAALAAGDEIDRLDFTHQAPGGIRFAAGSFETFVAADEPADGAVAELTTLIRALCHEPVCPEDLDRLDHLARVGEFIAVVDPVLATIRADESINRQRLHDLGRRLATTATDRGPVKLGIALLGLFPADRHREILMVFSRHDEFSLYAVVALMHQSAPDDDLWTVARNNDCWGRIHAVRRLADTSRADIREWILRGGFRNGVLNEYLAFIAASEGGLLAALTTSEIDPELLEAARDIIAALIDGGPAEDMRDYADGALAVTAYLRHLVDQRVDLSHLITVDSIRRYTQWDEAPWSQADRASIRRRCEEIAADPGWLDQVQQQLDGPLVDDYWTCLQAAKVLGVASLSTIMRWLDVEPCHSSLWFFAMKATDVDFIGQVVAFAEQRLPLAEIASGPADEYGFGEEWLAHMCLDTVVWSLDTYPGVGWELIRVALASPIIRSRIGALRCLEAWTASAWPTDASDALRAAHSVEVDDDVRARIESLLHG